MRTRILYRQVLVAKWCSFLGQYHTSAGASPEVEAAPGNPLGLTTIQFESLNADMMLCFAAGEGAPVV